MTERERALVEGVIEDERESNGRRRFDKALPFITMAMGALAVIGVVVAVAAGRNNAQIENNADKVERAVCAVLTYTEKQSRNVANPRSAKELQNLGRDMRKTGVRCPPTRPNAPSVK